MYCDWPTLGRCCFCMPLRRGVLTFGYINLIFSAFMVGVYSYSIHADFDLFSIYHGINVGVSIPQGVCVAIYCLEIVFTAVLLYGTHKKLINYIKTYYYFAVTTTVASVLVQIIDFAASVSSRMGFYMVFEVLPLMFAALTIQVYLIILIRSLLKKMEEDIPHGYENQLQQIVYEGKVDGVANGVYDPTVVPVDL
ncbi:hypothetical protein PYW07_012062 [Mythimna separata]|uniref:Uncharacterized protein n=1 Tax=Mythimna separata TaxID=271217 RepID=A0AAD7YM90_MYTSE|nr:hypothetical protein PYW07_012062 [Mythimna separata]